MPDFYHFDKSSSLSFECGMRSQPAIALPRTEQWEKIVFVIAIAMMILRAYVSTRVGLGDDEAYYWEWSRHLQLSYFDHPAMVAWMIKAGVLLFGQTAFGIRVFGLVCNALSGVLIWKLGTRMFGRVPALLAVICYLFAPIYCLGGFLMVPDAPMGVAWMAVQLLTWRIFGEGDDRWSTWFLAGAILGVGLLSKYTILLLALSIVLFMFTEKRWRAKIPTARFGTALILAVVLALPIVIWNSHFDWPTLQYHLHDRQMGGGGANFIRWGQFWASQAILLGPMLFVLCLAVWGVAVVRWRDPRWRFVFVMSFPTFALFCVQALFAEFKPHWPVPVYALMFIAVGQLFDSGFGLSNPDWRKAARVVVATGVLAVFVPLNIFFHIALVSPVLPKAARAFSPKLQWDPKFDPSNDLYGWPEVTQAARAIQVEFAMRGEPVPFLSSSRYQLVSQLAFAAQERVWRVSPGRDQYGFWQTPDAWRPLVGRSSVFVTDSRFERDPRGDGVFKSCEERPSLLVYRGDELARRFHIWVCRDFLGLK